MKPTPGTTWLFPREPAAADKKIVIVIDDDEEHLKTSGHTHDSGSRIFEPRFIHANQSSNGWQWYNLTQADFARTLYRQDSSSTTLSADSSALVPSNSSGTTPPQSSPSITTSAPVSSPSPVPVIPTLKEVASSPIDLIDLTGHDEPTIKPRVFMEKRRRPKNDQPSTRQLLSPEHPLAPSVNLTKKGSNPEDAIEIDETDVEILGEQKLLDSGLMLEPDLRGLRRDENTRRDGIRTVLEKPVRRFSQRNAPIVPPLQQQQGYRYGAFILQPKSTVELFGGDFLIIKDIIRHSTTQVVTLRGFRVQRSKHLNGMLEKKLNEVCLFVEIDLDDPREAHEQSVVEVPVTDVTKTRSLQCTNHEFPECRNFSKIASKAEESEVYDCGGLTLRWKYTCTFATAADRYDNVYKERALEHIREDDFFATIKTSDAARRVKWRGETVLGGSYLPEVLSIPSSPEINQQDQLISISSTGSPICSRDQTRKRTHSTYRASIGGMLPQPDVKKSRKTNDACIGLAQSMRRLSIKVPDGEATPVVYDLTGDDSSDQLARQPLISDTMFSPQSNMASRSIPPSINVLPSELSTPSPSGMLQFPSSSPPTKSSSLFRPGQKLTYGDAFCGAGGTTRGALQAGLSIKWGFDSNPNACLSWRSNFPSAACYELASHEFVRLATPSASNPCPIDVKVDILHLSPPCQFFSPAHTCVGVNDEKNQAAMFAVQAVIGVAKPRVVTLEQTFGVCSVRHRWFFAALIHMFTSLRFSLRWSVVGLPQWVSQGF